MSPVAFEQKLDHVLFAAHQKGWIVSVNARRFQGGFGLRQRKPAQGHQVDKELLSIDVPSGLLRSPNVRQMCQYTYSFAIRIVNVTYNRGGSQEQRQWIEAERCYRKSLALAERLGDAAGGARTCNQLAIVAMESGRPGESEGWFHRALVYDEQANPGSPNAAYLANLANLLVSEVQSGQTNPTRLAEQSLALQETHESSFTQIWNTLGLLAEIATLEGHPEETRTYRRQERETYAAFVGNRHLFEQRLESLITPIAAAALGDDEARQQMETALAELEAHDWHITTATHRLWTGERDWHTLAEDLGKGEALLILLVLETLASLEKASPSTQLVPEAIQALLPSPVLEDFQQEDQDDLDLELANLSPEAQQVLAALQAFRRQVKSDELEQGK